MKSTTIKLEELKRRSIELIKSLRYPNGLFAASKQNVNTGYDKVWIRDNVYIAMGLEKEHPELVEQTYHRIFDIFLKHEGHIDRMIENKLTGKNDHIHARYDPYTLKMFKEDWGNIQNDMIGLFLFKVGELTKKGFHLVRTTKDLRILRKLVQYLETIEYYRKQDNGIWENEEEIHASSVGACVAGLKKIQEAVFQISRLRRRVPVPRELVRRGEETLQALLPRESPNKETDLALLSLIWPYNLVDIRIRNIILKNVEERLVKKRGVVRYDNDYYYKNENGEAEWTMGLPWLAIIYNKIGNETKAEEYLQKTLTAVNERGELPELYYSNTPTHNDNSPLGWAQSILLTALEHKIEQDRAQ